MQRPYGLAQVGFGNRVQLERLARRQAQRIAAVVPRQAVDVQVLLGRAHATGQADTHHEAVEWLQLLALAVEADVAIVLLVHPVELEELLVRRGNAAGDGIAQPLRNAAAQVVARVFDGFVLAAARGRRVVFSHIE